MFRSILDFPFVSFAILCSKVLVPEFDNSRGDAGLTFKPKRLTLGSFLVEISEESRNYLDYAHIFS